MVDGGQVGLFACRLQNQQVSRDHKNNSTYYATVLLIILSGMVGAGQSQAQAKSQTVLSASMLGRHRPPFHSVWAANRF